MHDEILGGRCATTVWGGNNFRLNNLSIIVERKGKGIGGNGREVVHLDLGAQKATCTRWCEWLS